MSLDLKIVGVSRGSEYSPNHIGNDAAIFTCVVQHLEKLGHIVETYTERDFVTTGPGSQVVFNMARDRATIARLKELEDEGVLVINSAYGIDNCVRRPMTEILLKHGVPYPESCIVDLNDVTPARLVDYPCWVKRGDSHAIVKEDVSYATCWEDVSGIFEDFRSRGIPDAVINKHLSGDLIKFYGIRGGKFFYWFYPSPCSHSKFGLEKINGDAKGIPFSEDDLKAFCEQASSALDVPVYGGDCVVTTDGKITIIDFNDWPSFARCREEASQSIAEYIVERIKERYIQ